MVNMRNAFNGYASYPQIQFHEKAAMITRQNRAPFFDDWVRLRSKLKGEEHKDTLLAANNYANILNDMQRHAEAKALLRKTMPVARQVVGEDDRLTLTMRKIYARALYEDPTATLDDLREAVTTLEDVARIARRVLGSAHPNTAGIEIALRDARAALRAREALSPPAGEA